MKILGLDIGGSSLKTGILDTGISDQVAGFREISLTKDDQPDVYQKVFKELVEQNPGIKAIGVGFPNIVKDNIIIGEGNMHPDWDRISIPELFRLFNVPVFGINDADAAGFAEINGPNSAVLTQGVCLFLVLGTGIGSSVFVEGRMIPNTEMGLIQMHGMLAELYTAPSIKTKEKLSWDLWCARLQEYLTLLEIYLAPDTIVLGGGISRDWDLFGEKLHCEAQVYPASYRDLSGVIGAAKYAGRKYLDLG